MDGTIAFNANSLQTFNRSTRVGIITDHIDLESVAEKDISVYALAHTDQSAITGEVYPSRTIQITGTIASDTPTNLSALLDTFRGYLNGRNKNLDIGYGGIVRRYIATAQAPTITRSEDKKYAKFTLTFLCVIPFGVDTTNTTAVNQTGRTLNAYSDTYTFVGSAPVQLPVATLTLTALSSTGAQQMYFGNNDTGQTITITRANWAVNDVVVIDSAQRRVTVNGIDVDFAGAFPEFTSASHVIVYGDTFTSRTLTESVVYAKRYL